MTPVERRYVVKVLRGIRSLHVVAFALLAAFVVGGADFALDFWFYERQGVLAIIAGIFALVMLPFPLLLLPALRPIRVPDEVRSIEGAVDIELTGGGEYTEVWTVIAGEAVLLPPHWPDVPGAWVTAEIHDPHYVRRRFRWTPDGSRSIGLTFQKEDEHCSIEQDAPHGVMKLLRLPEFYILGAAIVCGMSAMFWALQGVGRTTRALRHAVGAPEVRRYDTVAALLRDPPRSFTDVEILRASLLRGALTDLDPSEEKLLATIAHELAPRRSALWVLAHTANAELPTLAWTRFAALDDGVLDRAKDRVLAAAADGAKRSRVDYETKEAFRDLCKEERDRLKEKLIAFSEKKPGIWLVGYQPPAVDQDAATNCAEDVAYRTPTAPVLRRWRGLFTVDDRWPSLTLNPDPPALREALPPIGTFIGGVGTLAATFLGIRNIVIRRRLAARRRAPVSRQNE